MKKKLDDLTQAKLIYSGELLLFAILFTVLGVLFLTGVIAVRDWKRWAFSIVTLLGGIWLVVDLIWTIVSKKRRARSCLLDKAMVAPMALAVLVFDILSFVFQWVTIDGGDVYYRFGIGIAISYYAFVYYFQAIYHWFHPTPAIFEAIDKAEAVDKADSAPQNVAEAPKEANAEENVETKQDSSSEEK